MHQLGVQVLAQGYIEPSFQFLDDQLYSHSTVSVYGINCNYYVHLLF